MQAHEHSYLTLLLLCVCVCVCVCVYDLFFVIYHVLTNVIVTYLFDLIAYCNLALYMMNSTFNPTCADNGYVNEYVYAYVNMYVCSCKKMYNILVNIYLN